MTLLMLPESERGIMVFSDDVISPLSNNFILPFSLNYLSKTTVKYQDSIHNSVGGLVIVYYHLFDDGIEKYFDTSPWMH